MHPSPHHSTWSREIGLVRKRIFQQVDIKYPMMDREGPVILNDALKAKCLFQYPLQQVICKYCQKPNHIQSKCRMANGMCFVCWCTDHTVNNCPFKKTYRIPPTFPAWVTPPTLWSPPLRRSPGRSNNAPQAKRPFWLSPQQVVCNFCQKLGHFKCDCWKRNGLCLKCGSKDHLINDWSLRRTKNSALDQPALPAPPVMRNRVPTSKEALLPSQQHAFSQAQEDKRIGVDSRKSQVYHFIAEEAKTSHEVVERYGAQYPELEP